MNFNIKNRLKNNFNRVCIKEMSGELRNLHRQNNINYGYILCKDMKFLSKKNKLKWTVSNKICWITDTNINNLKTYKFTDFYDNKHNPKKSIEVFESNYQHFKKYLNYDNAEIGDVRDIIYFVSDTTNWARIDIDDPEKFNKFTELQKYIENKKPSHILSRNSNYKKDKHLYKHYFIKKRIPTTDDSDTYKKRLGFEFGDYLQGQACWYRLDEKIKNLQGMDSDYSDFHRDLLISSDEDINLNDSIDELPKQDKKSYSKYSVESYDSLCDIIDKKYFEDFETWLKFRFILQNELGEKGLNIFIKHSRRAENADDFSTLINKYNNYSKKYENITMGTLRLWAKKSNSRKYKKWNKNNNIPNEVKDDYEEIKEEFEKTHFFMRQDTKIYRIMDEFDELYDYTPTQMLTNAANVYYTETNEDGKKEKIAFYQRWIKDITRREYERFDFIPNLNYQNPRVYNEFKGFKLDTDCDYDETSVNLFLNHINTLCNNEKIMYDYLLNYTCHLIQKPYELPLAAIVLKSEEGCGKDMFLDFIEKIIGKFVFRTSKIEDVVGNFNGGIKKKLVVQINELEGKKGYEYRERLKDLITADKITINIKNQKKRNYKNFVRLFIMSNLQNPVNINNTDRRYFISYINEKKPKEYFDKLGAVLADTNALKSILKYLSEYDISKFNPTIIPISKEKKIMMRRNIPYVYTYLYDKILNLDDYWENCEDVFWDKKNQYFYIKSSEFIKNLNRECKDEGYDIKYSTKSLKSTLSHEKYFKSMQKRIDGTPMRVFQINLNELKDKLKKKLLLD